MPIPIWKALIGTFSRTYLHGIPPLFTQRSRDTPACIPPETDEYPPQLNLDGQLEPLVRLAEALLCFF